MFEKVRNKFYEGTDGAFLCFDCTRKESFESMMKWNEEIPEDIKFKILICNKIDLVKERKIYKQMGIDLAKILKIPTYEEISAKNNLGVTQIYQKMLSACLLSIIEI